MLTRLMTAALLVTAVPAMASFTMTFDALQAGDNANLDPVAQAHGITFVSTFVAPDLDANGDEIPGQTHWEAYPDPNGIYVVNPVAFGRNIAPSQQLMLNGLFDQTLISFAHPTKIDGFSFLVDTSTYGDLFYVTIPFVDAAGKTVFTSPDFLPTTLPGQSFSFAPIWVSGIVLVSTSKLYDNISISVVPEPANWALFTAGLALTGAAVRRRRSVARVVA